MVTQTLSLSYIACMDKPLVNQIEILLSHYKRMKAVKMRWRVMRGDNLQTFYLLIHLLHLLMNECFADKVSNRSM